MYICHFCRCPTLFNADGVQTPGVPHGESVRHISDEGVAEMYEEARRAFSAGAFTAAILCCRKLLMHVAVSKGAKEGGSFISYVEYLANEHYVPPDAREWVDQIRKIGNEANHEIHVMKTNDAQELISFCEMLLKVIFEFPHTVRARQSLASRG
jgi:hypothetical protein